MEIRYKEVTYKLTASDDMIYVLKLTGAVQTYSIHRLHPDVQDAFDGYTWDIEKLPQLLDKYPFTDMKLPKTPKGFELFHRRYWTTTWANMNPFLGVPRCSKCHRLPLWQRSWDETDRPYTVTEFKCFCGETWQEAKVND